MASHSPDVEILVHVAAPSRAADDVAYRRLAHAYLAFAPQTRTSVAPGQPSQTLNDGSQAAGPPVRGGVQSPAPLPSTREIASPAPDQLIPLDSQELSFRSAIDNRSSPGFQPPKFRPAQTVGAAPSETSQHQPEQSWSAPPSQVSDSYPMPDASLLHPSPARVLERYLGGTRAKSPASPSPSRQQKQSTVKARFESDPVEVASSFSAPSSQPSTSDRAAHRQATVIPVTPAVSKPLARKGQEESDKEPVVLDVTHISSTDSSQPLGTTSFRSESEPPPSKRPKTSNRDPAETLDLVRSSSYTGPARTADAPSIHQDLAQALEISPPSPPVGVSSIDPSSFVSEKLAKLDRDISSRYRPEARRDVGPLERGYWLVDCATWSPDTMLVAWAFLANYLRKGHAGWGVWCRRDASHRWLRLYCWGQVARHTYLLLYLASGRHLKTTGAEWHGADGDVAVVVSPAAKQT